MNEVQVESKSTISNAVIDDESRESRVSHEVDFHEIHANEKEPETVMTGNPISRISMFNASQSDPPESRPTPPSRPAPPPTRPPPPAKRPPPPHADGTTLGNVDGNIRGDEHGVG